MFRDLSGTAVQYSPETQYNIAMDGGYPFAGNYTWGWRAAYSWRDDQFIGSKNHPVTDVQPAYGKFDASLYVEDEAGKWRIALVGLNLNDEITGNFANDTREYTAHHRPDSYAQGTDLLFYRGRASGRSARAV